MQKKFTGLMILTAILAVLPLILPNEYFYDVVIRIAINATIAIGLNLLIGYAGQISLGHAGFLGIGAYGSAILTTHYGFSPAMAMLVAVVFVGLLAFVIARPILKLKGQYLAMATLGLGIIISIIITNENQLTGGPDGMPVPAFSVFGFEITDYKVWYWIIAFFMLFMIWMSLNLIDSPMGRALRAIHGSEVAAQVVGINTTNYKVLIFVISAVVACFMGSVTAHYGGFVTPGVAGFFHSIELVTMVVVGGMASIYGSVIGAVILTLLPQLLSAFEGWETVIFGMILMSTMIFLPKGLVPTLMKKFAKGESA